eukprot:CAMPEP_0183577932 /NCGR_PEP_ID=MMETSP0371-20130417/140791_1 /TAXON_ID=268820 /ORGANISM="Peridinium aciculiferum, Strain PAER-2" /LENGTH=333 /DNA_ID=CAMNT_0025788309 /DNA_START=11 /DNA_END=1012 /DNA_ORIENTATION=+
MPFELQTVLAEKVDLDGSGKISEQELRKLIRITREDDYRIMLKAFAQQDSAHAGVVSLDQATAAFLTISNDRGMKTHEGKEFEEALQDTAAEGAVCLDGFLQAGMENIKKKRQTQHDGEASEEEKKAMRKMFDDYDDDGSGTMSFPELGNLIRGLFPIIDEELRPKLNGMMKEVERNSFGSMDFQDFVLIVRQFLELQAEVMMQKESKAVQSSGFTSNEVQDFRELFQANDEDGDQELTWSEIRRLVGKVCVLDGGANAALFRAFTAAKGKKNEAEMSKKRNTATEAEVAKKIDEMGSLRTDTLDFPEFIMLMRGLLDNNFGNFKANLKADKG